MGTRKTAKNVSLWLRNHSVWVRRDAMPRPPPIAGGPLRIDRGVLIAKGHAKGRIPFVEARPGFAPLGIAPWGSPDAIPAPS